MLARLRRDRTLRAWMVAWVGGSVLGVVNGVLRELAYKNRVGDNTANQISAASLIGLLALYFAALSHRWPLRTRRDALEVGGTWVVLTVLFEFGFGHYVDHKSWSELTDNYNLAEGNLWTLVLVWIAVGPEVTRSIEAL